jgi:hypothetical protein
MRASMKARRALNRDFLAELSEGTSVLGAARQGKRTSRAHGRLWGQPEKPNRPRFSIHAALREECE